MLKESFSEHTRDNRQCQLESDLVIVGGGLSGVCAAITAARQGLKVVLVQDRPVLGGNASSEVRLWALGATSHMGNNNRWSREGGVIDEILLHNLRNNKEGNPLIFDAVLLDKVRSEPNIQLLLNCSVNRVNKSDARKIESVEAFCSQNSMSYQLRAPLFCDASGDGIVAFNAGASFRMGAESRQEFGEKLAAEKENRELLGHTLFFYSKTSDQAVEYIPPSFALDDIRAIPRYKILSEKDDGCRLWWIEYGGNRDTVYETEDIKWELWKIVYGIWDHIKNSGEFQDVESLTLEWVGTIPGKRESRRFEGDYMLTQQDIIEQREFDDAVAFGGWAIDIHPSEGVYTDKPPCSQWHAKGIYQIPYRCFTSRDIDNLFLAGRIISASHLAFGSTRVMLTCAHGAQAVAMAASLCKEQQLLPRALQEPGLQKELQQRLNLSGQSIPLVPIDKGQGLMADADISASSSLALKELPGNGRWQTLDMAAAQMLPLQEGQGHRLSVLIKADVDTRLSAELRISEKPENYTPEQVLKTWQFELSEGVHRVELDFSEISAPAQYGFMCLLANEHLQIKTSQTLVTGLSSVFNKVHAAVSNKGRQEVDADIGIEEFEFWTPLRRPEGQNLAMQIQPPLEGFGVENLSNGYTRPNSRVNAWIADFEDKMPQLTIRWPEPKNLKGICLQFDGDFDQALETVLMGHAEHRIPLCVERYRIKLANGEVLHSVEDNFLSLNRIEFEREVISDTLIIELDYPDENAAVSVFDIECF